MGFWNGFFIIIKKRWLEFYRSPADILSFAITSIFFTLLSGVLSIVIFNKWNNSERNNLLDNAHIDRLKVAVYGSESSNYQTLINELRENTKYEIETCESYEDMTNKLYQSSSLYAFGVNLTQYADNSINVTVLYNDTASDTEVMKAEVSSVLLKGFMDKKTGKNVKFEYIPLNAGLSSSILWGTFGPLLASFALITVGPSLIFAIVRDKENQRLHSLLTSGLSGKSYWIGNFVFDFIIYTIVGVISWAVLYLFNTGAYVENHWTATFFLNVFFGFENLAYCYFLSMFFSTLIDAQSIMFPVNNLFSVVPFFIVNLFLDNNVSTEAGIIISILPPFSIQRGLTVAAEKASSSPMDAKETWTSSYTGLFAVQVGAGIVYLILAFVTLKIQDHMKGKKMRESNEGDENNELNKDENVAEMERKVLNNEVEDEAVVIKHLTRVFTNSNHEPFKAVDNLSLYVKRGEMFGVLGANGAGKTTLMSMITGKINKSNGKIRVLGHDIKTPTDVQDYVSICPQFNNHLFPLLTPREHLVMYGRLKGLKGKDLDDMVNEYIDLMTVEEYADQKMCELSDGNQRKLAICLAFLGDHPIIFLDEPTASLDPISRMQVQNLVKLKSEGKTILLCTHLLAEAEALCDRICIMFSGKIEAFGTPQQLASQYGRKWKIELGLNEESEECREEVDKFVHKTFTNAELSSTKYATVTYTIPKDDISISDVFVILAENQGKHGYGYFTCSMCTLERVFIDLVAQYENN